MIEAYSDDWGRICLRGSFGGFGRILAKLTPSEAERLGRDLIDLADASRQT